MFRDSYASSLLKPQVSMKAGRPKHVLAKFGEGSRTRGDISKPPKSSILPGCRHCKIRMRNLTMIGRKSELTVSRNAEPAFIAKLKQSVDNELKKNMNPMMNSSLNDVCSVSLNCDHLLCEQKMLDAELAVYRSAFEVILNKITTFEPLLKRIKSVYDKCIVVRDDRIKLTEIISANLREYKKKVEQKVEAIQRAERTNFAALKSKNICLEEVKMKLQTELEESRVKINSLRNEILKNEEREIRRIMKLHSSLQKNRLQDNEKTDRSNKTELQMSAAKELTNDPTLMSICLERARKDLSTAHRKIAELEDTFRDVVPKWELERLENRYQALERKYRHHLQEMEALTKGHETLKLNFDAVREQKNDLRDRYKMLAHTNTPRPDWSKAARDDMRVIVPTLCRCGQFIQGGVQRWRDITEKKSSEDRLMILLSELCGAACAENNYFVGQGTDPSVPVFLRWKGKMRNRKLGRREVSMLINDLWKNKVVRDSSISMGDYLVKYFTERYSIELLRYEWIYNLYYACQRLVYDDQIGLFWNILWGNVAEDAYHGPRKEFAVLKKMMEMRIEDKKINALLSQDIIEVLDTMYAYKSNKDIEKIVYAAATQLGIDPSTEAFDMAKLFADTEEGWERGEFFRELARQISQEITTFGKEILHSINVQDENSEVPVDALKKGFTEIDEGISQALLTQHLKWIYKVQDLSKAKPMVSSAIVRQMLNGYIKRSGPKNQQRNNN